MTMIVRAWLHLVSLFVVGGLVAALSSLTAAPSHAEPVFTGAKTGLDPAGGARSTNTGNDCQDSVSVNDEPTVPVVENGPPATVSNHVSATYTHTTNPVGTAAGSASTTATAGVTSVGGTLRTMDFATHGTAQVSSGPVTESCGPFVESRVIFDFRFEVARPGVLTLDMRNVGTTGGLVTIWREHPSGTGGSAPVYSHSARGGKLDLRSRVFLPDGFYTGWFEGGAFLNVPGTVSGTWSVSGRFTLAGEQTSAPRGKATRYVDLPGARSCATHAVTPSITAKGKRAKAVKRVSLYVNDALVTKVKKVRKGKAFALPVADHDTAQVRAEVKLRPTRPGRPGKVVEATSTYEACS